MTFPVLIAHRDWFTRVRLHLWLEEMGFTVAEAGEGDLAYLVLAVSSTPWLTLLEEAMPLSPKQTVLAALLAQPALCDRHALVLLASSMASRESAPSLLRVQEPLDQATIGDAVREAIAWLKMHIPQEL